MTLNSKRLSRRGLFPPTLPKSVLPLFKENKASRAAVACAPERTTISCLCFTERIELPSPSDTHFGQRQLQDVFSLNFQYLTCASTRKVKRYSRIVVLSQSVE